MGQLVVTTQTPVGCTHPPSTTPGGSVNPDQGDGTLTVGGQAVRTVTNVAGQNIDSTGCTQAGDQTHPKCTAVGPTLSAGAAAVLTVNGVAVVRADLSAPSFAAAILNGGTVVAGTVEHNLLTTD
jgi:hypothetical protein